MFSCVSILAAVSIVFLSYSKASLASGVQCTGADMFLCSSLAIISQDLRKSDSLVDSHGYSCNESKEAVHVSHWFLLWMAFL